MKKKTSVRKLNREARKYGFDTWAQYATALRHNPLLMQNLMRIAAVAHANTEAQRARK